MNKPIAVAAIQPASPDYVEPGSPHSNLKKWLEVGERNLDQVADLIAQAGESGADLVCTPEDVGGINVSSFEGDGGRLFLSVVEAHFPRVLSRMQDLASRYRMHVAFCAERAVAGEIENVATLLDRSGQVIGEYRKLHLPAGEFWCVRAGDEFPVFQTEFGRVGMTICYDFHHVESALCLALNGADILLWPTYNVAHGGEEVGVARMRIRAYDNGLYVVASTYAGPKGDVPGRSMIVSYDGSILADAGYQPGTWISASIDPTAPRTVETDAEESGIADWRTRRLLERRPECYGAVTTPQPPARQLCEGVRKKTGPEVEEVFRRRQAAGQWRREAGS